MHLLAKARKKCTSQKHNVRDVSIGNCIRDTLLLSKEYLKSIRYNREIIYFYLYYLLEIKSIYNCRVHQMIFLFENYLVYFF